MTPTRIARTWTLAALLAACSSGDNGTDTDSGVGDPMPTPRVTADASYTFTQTTEVYGQGLRHEDWGGAALEPMDLLLDLYVPDDAPGPRPAMVIIHGGGFVSGTRTHPAMQSFAEYFAARGWVCASIDYRLASDRGTLSVDWLDTILPSLTGTSRDQVAAMYPASRDAKAAVRWMRAHADEFQIHPDYVTALGGSAGSFLAVMLGVTDEADFTDELLATEDPTLEGTWPEQSAAVQTIIDHWGAGSIAELAGFIDGQSRFDASDAPISIVHGTEDPTVLFEEAEELEATWVETGVPYVFHPLEGAGHGPWGASVDGKDLSMLAMDFIVEQQALELMTGSE